MGRWPCVRVRNGSQKIAELWYAGGSHRGDSCVNARSTENCLEKSVEKRLGNMRGNPNKIGSVPNVGRPQVLGKQVLGNQVMRIFTFYVTPSNAMWKKQATHRSFLKKPLTSL